jgi:hypothetical protein
MIVAKIKFYTDLKKIPSRCQDCRPFYRHRNNLGWAGRPCCKAMANAMVNPKERPEWCPLTEE